MIHSIIAYTLKEGFPFGQDGEVVHTISQLIIPGDDLFSSGFGHEGHEFLHEVDFGHHSKKLLNFKIELSFNEDPNSLPFVLAADCQVLFLRLKFPSTLVYFLLEKCHILHFHLYPVDSMLLLGCHLFL